MIQKVFLEYCTNTVRFIRIIALLECVFWGSQISQKDTEGFYTATAFMRNFFWLTDFTEGHRRFLHRYLIFAKLFWLTECTEGHRRFFTLIPHLRETLLAHRRHGRTQKVFSVLFFSSLIGRGNH
jgi:hypothetical protein